MELEDVAMKLDIKASTIKIMVCLRKALLILCSVSILSFFLSLFTGLSYLHSYSYYLSWFHLLSFLTQTIERKYMFIICNGILIFLAGNNRIHGEITDADAEEELLILQAVEEAPRHHDFLENQADEDIHVRVGDSEEDDKEESEAVDEEDDGNNTQELNRKIEEFISKMKQQLQLQAQAQAQAQAQQQHLIPASSHCLSSFRKSGNFRQKLRIAVRKREVVENVNQ